MSEKKPIPMMLLQEYINNRIKVLKRLYEEKAIDRTQMIHGTNELGSLRTQIENHYVPLERQHIREAYDQRTVCVFKDGEMYVNETYQH